MNIKEKFISNAKANLIASPIRFALNIYLASILSPSDYGKMVIPNIFLGISTLFIDSGFRSSLIQKHSLNSQHNSTVFYFNFLIALAFATIFIIVSVPLKYLFNIPELQKLVILISFVSIFSSLSMVNEARLQIKTKFSEMVFADLIAYFIGYMVAIFFAIQGFGVYSIIALYLVSSITYSIILFRIERFIPKISEISKTKLFYHLRVGKHLLGQGLLEVGAEKFDEIILSRTIDLTSLGVYSKGKELASIVGVLGSKFFARPWFSIMSKISNDVNLFSFKYYKSLFILIILGIAIQLGFGFTGEKLISLFLGKNWGSIRPILDLFLIVTTLYFVTVFNKYTLLAFGLAKLNFRNEIFYLSLKVGLFGISILFIKHHIVICLILAEILSKIFLLIVQSSFLSKKLNLNLNILSMLVLFSITFGWLAYNDMVIWTFFSMLLFVFLVKFKIYHLIK